MWLPHATGLASRLTLCSRSTTSSASALSPDRIQKMRPHERSVGMLRNDSKSAAAELQQIAQNREGPAIMVFTSSLKLLYQDHEAWKLCAEINQHGDKNSRGILPASVIEVCNEVKKQLQLRTHSKDWEQFRIKRVLMGSQRPMLASGVGLPNTERLEQAQMLVTIEVMWRQQHA